MATVDCVPSLAGNAFYLAVARAILVRQTIIGIHYRTWGNLVVLFFGELGERIGYVARVKMAQNPFLTTPFLVYIACLNLDPAFLSAGIYLCLSRIIIICGEHLARFAPRTYTTIFVVSNIFALVLQAVGGALAYTADTSKRTQYGVNILFAGLSCQEVSPFCVMSPCADFAKQVRKQDATSKQGPRRYHQQPQPSSSAPVSASPI